MEIRAVKFRVGGEWRVGGLFRPARPGPTPGVLMLHGFPGVQQNEDIASELCRRGMTVLLPHYGGSWGSSGRFSVHGLFEDARAAAALLARYHHVDPASLGVVGYSVGGWVALKLASELRLAAAVVLAPAVPGHNAGDPAYLRRNGKVLNIPDFRAVWEEYAALAAGDPPEAYIKRIAPTPLLLVQGLEDRLVPPAGTRALYFAAREPKELLEFAGEAHEFQENRPLVVASVCDWLSARLPGGRPAAHTTLWRGIGAARA